MGKVVAGLYISLDGVIESGWTGKSPAISPTDPLTILYFNDPEVQQAVGSLMAGNKATLECCAAPSPASTKEYGTPLTTQVGVVQAEAACAPVTPASGTSSPTVPITTDAILTRRRMQNSLIARRMGTTPSGAVTGATPSS